MNIAIFANHRAFIQEAADALVEKHTVRFYDPTDPMEPMLDWADTAWFEFCDDLLIRASHLPKQCRMVCRLHSYEVFTDMPLKVNWENVDLLVFVSRHVMDFFTTYMPIKGKIPMTIIENGLNLDRFTIPENKVYGKKIASVGYINYKKNPGLLLYCFQKIHFYDTDYTLHVAGQFQDPRIEYYMKYYAERQALPIQYDSWVKPEDMPGWLADKDYIISTSYWESFQYSIAEGMACGLFPLIHRWPGADTIYPVKYIFNTPDDCLTLLKRLEKEDRVKKGADNRRFISRYDMKRMIKMIETVMYPPMSTVPVSEETGPSNIALCMIVCNEEAGIARCIESAKSVVDETIVLVDTKTQDRTAEIAEKCGAKVFPYEWQDDFAHARNTAMSRATTEWALVMDGHEYLTGDVGILRKIILEYPDACSVDLAVRMENGKVHHHSRLHKINVSHWENPAHNVLYSDGTVVALRDMDDVGNPRVCIVHDRYTGQTEESRQLRNKQRDDMLVRIFTKRLDEHPNDTRSLFYLAQQHKDAQRWKEARECYARYNTVENGNQWPEESYQAYYEAGRMCLFLNEPDEAVKYALKAAEVLPHRAEAWALCGDVAYHKQDWQAALKNFKKASECPLPIDSRLWVDQELHAGGWKVMDALAMCYWHLEEYEKGLEICKALLDNKGLPKEHAGRIYNNLLWNKEKLDPTPFNSVDYWEQRYVSGGYSGDGSRGRLAEYKAKIVNGVIRELGIDTVVDHGCGDGFQLGLFSCPHYVGLDVSPKAIEICKNMYGADSTKEFYLYSEAPEIKARLGLSLDVIFHLVEDEVYEEHMKRLFATSTECVLIYSTHFVSDRNCHILHREFLPWVQKNAPGWYITNVLENPFPYDPMDPVNTSMSRFFVFVKS